jgi:hypothetical protein
MKRPHISQSHAIHIREKLCQKIATLDNDATIPDIQEVLSTCFKIGDEADVINRNDIEDVNDIAATPLMVACGKGKISFLKYVAKNYTETHGNNTFLTNTQIIGDCLHASSIDGNNQAIHYAVSSPHALEYLSHIFMKQQSLDIDENTIMPMSQFEVGIKLLSQVNDHGDTPLMMAAASGDSFAIEHWVHYLASSLPSVASAKEQNVLKRLLAMTNTANDSALSLACGNGHCEVVEYLVSTESINRNRNDDHAAVDSKPGIVLPLVHVTYQDIQCVKSTLKRVQSVESKVPANKMEEFKIKQSNTIKCLDYLQKSSAQHAEQVSLSLLKEDEYAKRPKKSKKKSKKKKKRVLRGSTQNLENVCTNNMEGEKKKIGNESNLPCEEQDMSRPDLTLSEQTQTLIDDTRERDQSHDQHLFTKPIVFTSEDGTIVSDFRDKIKINENVITGDNIPKDENTIEHLLRERCDDTLSRKSDEVMESLCLDASMLLLSPHALAMKLSPSQLEAVEVVLKNQLEAVAQAKRIHCRLMSKSFSEDNCSS